MNINFSKYFIPLISISIFLLLINSCQSIRKNENKTSVQGMIYDYENEAVCDVSIFLNNKLVATSDIYGHFYIEKLIPNEHYSIRASKKDFEDSTLEFTFINASQIIYLHMFSAGELLKLAEDRVSEMNFHEARNLLDRAETAGGHFLSINYLRTIISFKEHFYNEALDLITKIINEGYSNSYIYLLAADIYETGFNDMEKTVINLQKSLEISYDPAVQKRISAILNQ